MKTRSGSLAYLRDWMPALIRLVKSVMASLWLRFSSWRSTSNFESWNSKTSARGTTVSDDTSPVLALAAGELALPCGQGLPSIVTSAQVDGNSDGPTSTSSSVAMPVSVKGDSHSSSPEPSKAYISWPYSPASAKASLPAGANGESHSLCGLSPNGASDIGVSARSSNVDSAQGLLMAGLLFPSPAPAGPASAAAAPGMRSGCWAPAAMRLPIGRSFTRSPVADCHRSMMRFIVVPSAEAL